MNTKLDSIKVTLAGVLAKELNPFLRTLTPTPTIVPVATSPGNAFPTTTRSTADIVNLIQGTATSTDITENTVNLVPTTTRSTENTVNVVPTVTRSTADIVNLVPSVTTSTEYTANTMVSMAAMPVSSSPFSGPTTLGGSPSTSAISVPSVGNLPTPS